MFEIKFKGFLGKRYRNVVKFDYESHVATEVDGKNVFTPVEIGLVIETKDGLLHFEPSVTKRRWYARNLTIPKKEPLHGPPAAEP